jgi:peptide-methionine (S)-S-oxide reductase
MNQYIKTDPGLDKKAIATFGNGCFWCTEAIFRMVDGVIEVNSGYSGGHTPNPDYESVCSGTTGHAECIQVIFDPGKLSYDRLLEIFWNTHDPTTLNRQGNDIGTQYRSVVFYHDDLQYHEALSMMKKLEASGIFKNPIVTTLEPFKQFYPAESYHQDYYRLNGRAPYCQYVIRPKVEKFRKNLQ